MYIDLTTEEANKCKDNPYYFFTTYWTVNGEKATTSLPEEDFNKRFKELTGSRRKRFTKIIQNKPEVTRKFFGKTEGFKDHYNDKGEIIRTAKEEQAFEKAHLKAYLKGRTNFQFGSHRDHFGIRRPNIFKVATEEYNSDKLIEDNEKGNS